MDLREQERSQRSARGVVPVGLAPGTDEDLLHHFLGQHSVTEHPPRQREARPTVAAVQLGERGFVALDDRGGQGGVVGLLASALRAEGTGSHDPSTERPAGPDDIWLRSRNPWTTLRTSAS